MYKKSSIDRLYHKFGVIVEKNVEEKVIKGHKDEPRLGSPPQNQNSYSK